MHVLLFILLFSFNCNALIIFHPITFFNYNYLLILFLINNQFTHWHTRTQENSLQAAPSPSHPSYSYFLNELFFSF